jgi:hypothetical protein
MQMMHSVMYQTYLNQGVICFKYTILLYDADVNGILSLLLREVRFSIDSFHESRNCSTALNICQIGRYVLTVEVKMYLHF